MLNTKNQPETPEEAIDRSLRVRALEFSSGIFLTRCEGGAAELVKEAEIVFQFLKSGSEDSK